MEHNFIKNKVYKEIFIYFLFGVFIHGYFFMNRFHNWDSVNQTYTNNLFVLENGRWFSPVISLISGNFISPWFFGILCLAMLAFSAYLVNLLFDVRDKMLRIIVALLFMGYPVFAATFTYLNNSVCYMVGIFLSILSVYILRTYSGWKWFSLGAAALLFSLGLYQAYICFAIVICIFIIALDLFDENYSERKTGIFAIKVLGAGILAGILDLLLIKFSCILFDVPLRQNNGFSSVGMIQMGTGIINAYKRLVDFLFFNGVSHNSIAEILANMTVLLSVFICGVILLYKRKDIMNWRKIFLLSICILVFPVGINFMLLIAPFSNLHYLTHAAYVLLYILPVLLISKIKLFDAKKCMGGV